MPLTNEPLTSGQKALPSGAVFPSGEANFYDFSQSHEYNGTSGINATYPSTDTFDPSGAALATYGADGTVADKSGIFNMEDLSSRFSNANSGEFDTIDDFTTFNSYIHFQSGVGGTAAKIPYISTYNVSTIFDPYSL